MSYRKNVLGCESEAGPSLRERAAALAMWWKALRLPGWLLGFLWAHGLVVWGGWLLRWAGCFAESTEGQTTAAAMFVGLFLWIFSAPLWGGT